MTKIDSPCDEHKLVALLSDRLGEAETIELYKHVSTCQLCQSKTEELAASESEWNQVSQALKSELEYAEYSRYSTNISLPDEVPQWTESMAKQLLSPPSHPEMLGRLGRYEVERLIGIGGMGVVFKAHDNELQRPVAIKILAPYLAGSGTARHRFAREARAAAAVVHQHVVPIHNVETNQESPFLVMHYVAGESLQSRIDREGPLNIEQILRIGMQVAGGLSAAHAQGLVHRDIKPSNILLEESSIERALITDFGLARAANDIQVTRTGVFMGTPQYMSPEQAKGEAVDYRSDLYSLGSLLYTLATGVPAFRAETPLAVMRKIIDENPTSIRSHNPKIPDWFCQLIGKLMNKGREARYSSAQEVELLLKGCLEHISQPQTVDLPEEMQKLVRKNRATAISDSTPRLALSLMGCVAVILCLYLVFQNQTGKVNPEPKQKVITNGSDDNENSPFTSTSENTVEILGHGYTRRGDHIFYDDKQIDREGNFDKSISRKAMRTWNLAQDVDANSFRALNAEYSKDNNAVYFKYYNSRFYCFVELSDADPKTFEVVSESLAKDKNQVWWFGSVFPEADTNSLELVRKSNVWKDANSVWYQHSKIENADPDSFEHIGHEYFRDKNSVYWVQNPIKNADPKTFRLFADDLSYGIDKNAAYYQQNRIKNIDPASFDVLHQWVYKDKNGAYIQGVHVPPIKSEGFRKLTEIYGSSNALLTDGEFHYLYLLQNIFRLELEGDSLRITNFIIDWNLKHPEFVGEATAILTKNGWASENMTPEQKERFAMLIDVYRQHFEKAKELMQND